MMKVNDRFEFPTKLDLTKYLEKPSSTTTETTGNKKKDAGTVERSRRANKG